MIETALLATQPGTTQPGTLTGSAASRQSGALGVLDLTVAGSSQTPQTELGSNVASTKGAFRKSLEEFTGPIAQEDGASQLLAPSGEVQAKSKMTRLGSLQSNLRVVTSRDCTASSDTSKPGVLQDVTSAPVLPSKEQLAQSPTSKIGETSGTQQDGDGSAQIRLNPAKETKPSVNVRTARLSIPLKPISSHTPGIPALDGADGSSSPKVTMTAPSPVTANEAATLPQPEAPVAEPTAIPELASLHVPDDHATAVIATPSPEPSAALPVTASGALRSALQPVSGKLEKTKPGEWKSNRLAGKSEVASSSPSMQAQIVPAVEGIMRQPLAAMAANEGAATPTAAPITSSPVLHAGMATPTSALQDQVADQHAAAHAVPATASLEEADVSPQEDNVEVSMSVQPDRPATFAQILSSKIPFEPKAHQPVSIPQSTAVTAATVNRQQPTTSEATPKPDNPGGEKSLPSSDISSSSSSPGDAAVSSPVDTAIVTQPAQTAESTHPLTTIVAHVPPAASFVEPSPTPGPAPILTPSLAASLHDPAAALSFTSASDLRGFAQHTTLQATPNVLEVGVASGSHGWLKVRAELDGSGGVQASVTANSPVVAVGIHKDLPALSAYLSSESVGVSSLVVHHASASSQTPTEGAPHEANMNLGAGNSGGGPTRDQPPAQQASSAKPVDGTPADRIESIAGRLDNALPPSLAMSSNEGFESGNWLSVRA